MSVFSTALTIVTSLGGGATITGVIGYIRDNRKRIDDLKNQAGAHEISAWEQWRKDNEALRSEISELRSEVAGLRADIKGFETENKHLAIDNERLSRELENEKTKNTKLTDDNKNLQSELNIALRAAELPEVAKRAVDMERQKVESAATTGKENPDP